MGGVPRPHNTEFQVGDLVQWFDRETAKSFGHLGFGFGPFIVEGVDQVRRAHAEHPQSLRLMGVTKAFSGLWFKVLVRGPTMDKAVQEILGSVMGGGSGTGET